MSDARPQPADRQPAPAVLFTAFEPSGDDHASAVVAELRKRHPELVIYAWGGDKMERAGATIVEKTGQDAVVGVPGWKKIREHQLINKRVEAWLGVHPDVVVHVPVDSPAANFPICKIAKRAGRKVVHLVAPQLWAWGGWRIRKLRRCTDLVLCLLPFEEQWFRERGVSARFIGHPLFDETLDYSALDELAGKMGGGDPKLAVLPGSRPAEMRRNFPLMVTAFRELREGEPELRGMVAATTEQARASLYEWAETAGGWPEGLEVVVGQTDAVARWCDMAVVVSGTVTLQLTKQQKPMVIIYKTNELSYKLVGRWVIDTAFFTLPNLIAGREIVPELVPYFSGSERLVGAVSALMGDAAAQESQRLELRAVCEKFAGKRAARDAAAAIAEVAGVRSGPRGASEPKPVEASRAGC